VLFTKFKSSTAKEVIHALLSYLLFHIGYCGYDSCGCSSNHCSCGCDMKLVKTRLRNRLRDTSLDQARIEGPETLDNENLDCIVNHWKDKASQNLGVKLEILFQYFKSWGGKLRIFFKKGGGKEGEKLGGLGRKLPLRPPTPL